MPIIKITVDGRPALTTEQAAARYGLTHSSMRSALTRLAKLGLAPVAKLDGRKPLWDPRALDEAMGGRPGRGRRG